MAGLQASTAIVRWPGVGRFRFAFSELVRTSGDAVTLVPRSRWDAAAATGGAQHGGFVKGVELFDAAFFSMVEDAGNLHRDAKALFLEKGNDVVQGLVFTCKRLIANVATFLVNWKSFAGVAEKSKLDVGAVEKQLIGNGNHHHILPTW